jgi:cytochrome c-type biogenesis protein
MMSDLITPQKEEIRIEKARYQMTKKERWRLAASFTIPVVVVVGLLVLLLSVRNGAETVMANLATLLPVGYAFGAGMVASVNPCGFFLLPSYISYHLGTEEEDFYQSSAWTRIFKALLLGTVATAGFVVIFAITGSLISAGGQWLIRVFPFAGIAIGGVMILLGLWLVVTRRTLGIMAASRVTVSRERNLRNVFLFGIAYAAGSLSCTLPIFLVVVGGSLASQGLAASFSQFVSYALGMGTILIAVTLGSALFQGTVAKRLRQAMPYVHRASALFLVAAGAYLIYYWVFFAGLSF